MTNAIAKHADQILVPGTFPWAQAALASGAYNKWKRPDEMLMAVSYGAEVGLGPNASLNQIAVVNGKVSLHSGGLLALALASGKMKYHKVSWSGEEMEDDWTCLVQVGRHGMETLFEGSFSVKDAKRAGLWGRKGPWSSYPERMLIARAETYALRTGFADVVAGLTSIEEAGDYQPLPGENPDRAKLESWVRETREKHAPSAETDGVEATFEINQTPDPWKDPHWSGEVDLRSHIPVGKLSGMPWAACGPNEIELLQAMLKHGEDKGLPYWVMHAGQQLQAIDEAQAALAETPVGDLSHEQLAELERAHENDEAVVIEPKPKGSKQVYADQSRECLRQLVKHVKPKALPRDKSGDIDKLSKVTGKEVALWVNEQYGDMVVKPLEFAEWYRSRDHAALTTLKSFLEQDGADLGDES